MNRIAIIDDEINCSFIDGIRITKYRLNGTELKPIQYQSDNIPEYGHATVCAKILSTYAKGFEIINIVIMKDRRHPATIEALCNALEACIELNIELVSMSLGSQYLSDSIYLRKVVEKIHKKGIIMVSALSNDNFYTVPAGLSEVIGVCQDQQDLLLPGEVGYLTENFWDIQLIANCKLESMITVPRYCPSNSYAVPIVVADIIGLLQTGVKGVNEILENLKQEKKAISLDDNAIYESEQLPEFRVTLESDSEPHIQDVLDMIYKISNYEIVALTNHKVKDIRCFEHNHIGIKKEIRKWTTADMIMVIN